MKLIFQAFLSSLPLIFKLIAGTLIMSSWVAILMVKLYKDDGYYCDNAHVAVKTKQECFEWGGDWVKYKLNHSSVVSAMLFSTTVSTMEGWVYQLMNAMDFNGQGKAPKYNANEHIQIFYLLLFLVGGIILLNFFIGTVLSNYRRIKEGLSGEKHLSPIQGQWLKVKTYILSLEAERPRRLPANCFRRFCHKVCSHKAYKLFQGILLVLFLITSALSKATKARSLYWM